MARFRIFGREITIQKRLFGIGRDTDNWDVANSFGNTRSLAQLDSYKGIVYACINRISDTYAGVNLYVERKTGKDYARLDYHEFIALLNNPGGRDDKAIPISLFDLLFATAAFIELQGDCYWYMPLGNGSGKPREIIILRADKVGKVLNKKTGEIEGFFVRTNGGADKIPIEINEMLPFIGFNPKDPYNGVGTVQAAATYIETDQYASEFTKNFFKNNAGISGIVSVKGEITKGAFKKFTRAWRDKYEGVDNAGKVMMVRESEAAFTKVGLGLNELDMSALRDMSREDICLMFGVPLPLLGKADDSGLGRGNVETLEYIFAKYTIEPKLKRLDDILQFALQRYWKDPSLRICHENIIPEDKEHELAERDKGVDRWITRNEIRKEEGYEDVPGGDELRAPLATIPISEDLSAGSGSSTQSTSQTPPLKIKIHRKTTTHTSTSLKSEPEQQVTTNKEAFRLRLMRNQVAYERHYTKKFKPILIDQRKEALNNLEAHASGIKKDPNHKLFDDAKYDAEMEKQLMPILTNLGAEQGAIALVFAGDEEHEFRMNAPYEKLLRDSTKKMAKNFNDETLDQLNKTLAEGIQAGEAIDKLKGRVDNVYDGAENYRTLRVARTETLKASNNATEEAYKQTGYVTGKEWVVNPDACPQCLEFEGTTLGLDESFLDVGASYDFTNAKGETETVVNSYDDIDNPPLHPNCRCTIIPIR